MPRSPSSRPSAGSRIAPRSSVAVRPELRELARQLVTGLDILEDHLVATVGLSGAELAPLLALEAGLRSQIVAVLPGRPAQPDSPGGLDVRQIEMSAADFLRFPVSYDRIVMKDISPEIEDLETFLAHIASRLTPSGRLALIFTVADRQSESDPVAASHVLLRSHGYKLRRSSSAVARETRGGHLQVARDPIGVNHRFDLVLAT
jgi:hypothetical protein